MALFRKKKTEEAAPKDVSKKEKSVAKKPVVTKEKEAPKKKGDALFVQEKHILIRPLITEKITDMEAKGQYVFEVEPSVNKIEIKNEIKKTYNVDPVKVNIVTMKGKHVRFGRTSGKKKDWKKAVVILKKGDKIEAGKTK